MWCTNLNKTHLENVSKLDETVQVRGCLGRLLPSNKSRKRQGEKLSTQTSAPPVCMAKPSVVVLPSPKQNPNQTKAKENVVPITNIQVNRNATNGRNNRPRNKSKQSSIRGKDFVFVNTICPVTFDITHISFFMHQIINLSLNVFHTGQLRLGFHINGNIIVLQGNWTFLFC